MKKINIKKTQITKASLECLKKSATSLPIKRARYSLHQSPKDLVQQMVIALCRGSYVRPHRHIHTRTETFHVIEGDVLLVFFDARGVVTKKTRLSAKKHSLFMSRYPAHRWHTAYAVSRYAVIHEIIAGPYRKAEPAPWAPDYNDADGIRRFMKKMLCGLR